MKYIIFTIAIVSFSQIGWSQNIYQNYIQAKTMTNQTSTGFIDQIEYFDGLGRNVETVQKGITPTLKDLVSYQEYDAFGRKSNTWLPRVATNNNGSFLDSYFFGTLPKDIYQDDTKPYAKTVYEASPLSRVKEQYGAGANWHNNGKSVKTEYLTNNILGDLACIKYAVQGSGVNTSIQKVASFYPANQLYITKTTDEDGNIIYEFKDKLGQLLLTRRKDAGQSIDTYYVYDDFGNLCYVLQPESSMVQTGNDEQLVLKRFAFIYKYDERNRCIKKRLPGTDWIEMVYDKADRLILSQDGEQRSKTPKQWFVSKYDNYGRVLYTGLINRDIQESEKNIVRSNVVTESYVGGNQSNTVAGYSCTYFIGEVIMLTVNYYDNYSFLNLPGFVNLDYDAQTGFATRYGTNTNTAAAKGLLTGSITKILAENNLSSDSTRAAYYYDYRGQMIQTKTQRKNYRSSEYIGYNFTGQVTDRKVMDIIDSVNNFTEIYHNDYDHALRLVKTTHKLNNDSAIVLTANTYDELGRLKTTKSNNKESMKLSHNYNVRGWITEITGQNFGEKLYYNIACNERGIPRWNGNISGSIQYNGSYGIGFNYKYDNLNRLTEALNFFESDGYFSYGSYNSNYYYDKNGNITSMFRIEDLYAEKITIDYNGNQRYKVGYYADEDFADYEDEMYTDNCCGPYTNSFTDYTHGNTSAQFTFNKNGSLTSDPYKGNTISYNTLGMPAKISVPAILGTIGYKYSASGEKLEIEYKWHNGLSLDPLENTGTTYTVPNSTLTRRYMGNKVYENNTLKMILLPNGYISNNNYYFYLCDHLGNNNVVCNANGNVVQNTYFHPFGKPIGNGESSGQSAQPYKYNGKEEETMMGLTQYDYGARTMDYGYNSFNTVDPLTDKHPDYTPYAYVYNNPMILIDPLGLDSINVNNNGLISSVFPMDGNNRFYDEGGKQLFLNDPKNADSDLVTMEDLNEGDRLYYPLSKSEVYSEVDDAGKTNNWIETAWKSYGDADFTYSYLAPIVADDKGISIQKDYIEKGIFLPDDFGYFRVEGEKSIYNLYDAGNFIWGGWMKMNNYSLDGTLKAADWNSRLTGNGKDTKEDQRAVRNGYNFYLRNYGKNNK